MNFQEPRPLENMVHSRARHTAVKNKMTCGGQRMSVLLTDLELRAVSVFGAVVVSGLVGVPTMGFMVS